MPWETQKEHITESGVKMGKNRLKRAGQALTDHLKGQGELSRLARQGWTFQAKRMVCEVHRTVGLRCSPEVGKSKMLTMEERNERLERWDPDSRALCTIGKR